jgi:hypothetical protein
MLALWPKTGRYRQLRRHLAEVLGRPIVNEDEGGWAGPRDGSVSKPIVPLVNIKAGTWMFIPLKMVLIGIDPYPDEQSSEEFRDIAQVVSFWVTWTMKSVELRFSCRGLFRAASARWQAAGDQFTVGS